MILQMEKNDNWRKICWRWWRATSCIFMYSNRKSRTKMQLVRSFMCMLFQKAILLTGYVAQTPLPWSCVMSDAYPACVLDTCIMVFLRIVTCRHVMSMLVASCMRNIAHWLCSTNIFIMKSCPCQTCDINTSWTLR